MTKCTYEIIIIPCIIPDKSTFRVPTFLMLRIDPWILEQKIYHIRVTTSGGGGGGEKGFSGRTPQQGAGAFSLFIISFFSFFLLPRGLVCWEGSTTWVTRDDTQPVQQREGRDIQQPTHLGRFGASFLLSPISATRERYDTAREFITEKNPSPPTFSPKKSSRKKRRLFTDRPSPAADMTPLVHGRLFPLHPPPFIHPRPTFCAFSRADIIIVRVL